MEERFDLAPWELAPDSPEQLEGVAQTRIRERRGQREWLVRQVELTPGLWVLFVRQVESNDQGNWLYWNEAAWRNPNKSRGLCEHFLRLFPEQPSELPNISTRIFHLDLSPFGVNQRRWIIMDAQGEVRFKHGSGPSWNDTRFRLGAQGLKSQPATMWSHCLENELLHGAQGRFAGSGQLMQDALYVRACCVL